MSKKDYSSSEEEEKEVTTNRLYVGNLAYSVSWQDLKDYMRNAGNVTYTKVLTDYYGYSKGCGIVEFETVEDAKNAVSELNDTELQGRRIFLREDREDFKSKKRVTTKKEQTEGKKVYVGNLPFSMNWRELKEHFAEAGEIERANMLMSRGRPKGAGTVQFYDEESAKKAIEMFDGTKIDEREIFVKYDDFY
ncbi:RNA-binding protein [Anaeramoeba flamelloides]|uniref:RNA-binding protein n=1 Tax=Anaeramoeba flamelloides TaxID=1746091 RepID=A0ABQ8Z5S4_9EUKA|nr:RNA-binding protein [Anaeramoeba flamelloides]